MALIRGYFSSEKGNNHLLLFPNFVAKERVFYSPDKPRTNFYLSITQSWRYLNTFGAPTSGLMGRIQMGNGDKPLLFFRQKVDRLINGLISKSPKEFPPLKISKITRNSNTNFYKNLNKRNKWHKLLIVCKICESFNFLQSK